MDFTNLIHAMRSGWQESYPLTRIRFLDKTWVGQHQCFFQCGFIYKFVYVFTSIKKKSQQTLGVSSMTFVRSGHIETRKLGLTNSELLVSSFFPLWKLHHEDLITTSRRLAWKWTRLMADSTVCNCKAYRDSNSSFTWTLALI